MARVAVDARPLMKRERTGVENVSLQFLSLILHAKDKHQWHFYFTEPPTFALPQEIRWRSYRGKGWLRLIVPIWMLVDRIQLIHFGIAYVPPLARFTPSKIAVTACDIMWLDNINIIDPPSRKFILKGVLPSLKYRSDYFIAISEATKSDLIHKLGVPSDRVSLVYPYVPDGFKPAANADEAVRQLYGIEGRFLLFVGVAKPNKNIGRLLDAFSLVRLSHPDAKLVVAGFVMPFWEETQRLLRGEPNVIWLQYVPDDHLPLLYSACTAFVSPALNEGFGLPLLEAMACGAPVIAGNTGAQPEVVGDAGLLVNPFDVSDIADAMKAVLSDVSLRSQMSVSSIERSRMFNKERSLEQLLSAYEHALREG
ncbi:MAG: glycosyltransferase family 1 protein [Armatimonadota bacterium]|nr:glycosyltransferase family 4 protein [Armatimonadota bacterium]MCX7776999.1 glycosyltransferase family 4 protein [Armatimonadota bacterium]MDW8024833.1 glycosyltransferase family 1 protein [Armatimonadota bacterium]